MARFVMTYCGGRMTESPIVRVEQGELQGKLVNSPSGRAFYSFQGIPYAKPPIGSLRFRDPQPPEPWEDVRDATAEGNSCAQNDTHFRKQYLGDENCLFLNVYTPSLDGEFLPVLFYVHGGGYLCGSGDTYLYGADYLVEKDVVVVTINYRLGPLGFLCLNNREVPGNAALKDVAQALRWVKENIQNFGGNSGNVTVFGESSGAAIVSLLTASPMSKSLISRAIIQSGYAISQYGYQQRPVENAMELAKELGYESSDPDDVLECLTTTPVRDLIEANDRISSKTDTKYTFLPVIERDIPGVEAFLTEPFVDVLTSGRVASVPVMIGTMSLEGAFAEDTDDLQKYIPKDLSVERNSEEALAIAERIKQLYFKADPSSEESVIEKYQLMSDYAFNVNIHRHVQYHLNSMNVPIYYFKFAYAGRLNISGLLFKSPGAKQAGHMDALGYLFRNDLLGDVEPSPEDVATRERMVQLWTNFVKCGNPTPEQNHYLTATWLPATKDTLNYLHIGNELALRTDPDKERMDFWMGLYDKYYRIWEHPATNNGVVGACETVQRSTAPVIVDETVVTTVTTSGHVHSETQVTVQETSEHYQEIHTTNFVIESNGSPIHQVEHTLESETFHQVDSTSTSESIHQVENTTTSESIHQVEETSVSEPVHQVEEKPASEPVHQVEETSASEPVHQVEQTPVIEPIPQVELTPVSEPIHQVEQTPVSEPIHQVEHKPASVHIHKVFTEVQPPNVHAAEREDFGINIVKIQEKFESAHNGLDEVKFNGNSEKKPRPSNEIKMVQNNNINPKDVIRANDPPEDDLPKNIGVNKFVNFFESLGGKK